MSMASESDSPNHESEAPKWKPLTEEQRRVVGVLIEKAKTTPDQYPLSLNGLTSGCNQKSNRDPQMDLDSEDVQVLLDELREMGAVVEVQSGGRVAKFKHLMYDWLGVDKVEIAVMAELLLRGAQTLGDLRGRAARMEKIAGLSELKPIVQRLVEKKLVLELTPPGRGQLVTHALYEPDELQRVRASAASLGATSEPAASPSRSSASSSSRSAMEAEIAALKEQIAQLDERLAQLEKLVQ